MLNKLFKNKFFASTFILLIGGFLSKFLGFILKIIITRYIGIDGIGLYSMITPTFSLFITVATFSFPIAISKLVAIPKRSSKKVIFSIIPVSLIFNILSILIICLIAKPLSLYCLKDERLFYPIISIGLTLPFIGLSSIIKGYFWGKQRMFPYILSNIVEQIVRMILLVIFIPKFINKSIVFTICLIILVNIISETSSIIVMLLALPKGVSINKNDIIPSKNEISDVLNISVPSTTGKIIGSIEYFFEPIILTNVLSFVGYSNSYIVREYGILNGYSMALLLLPQFFTTSISTALIPELSKNYEIKNYSICKKRIRQIVLLSLAIGGIFTLFIFINPKFFLNLIYHTNLGDDYIRVLAPFMLLHFINVPLTNALQAMNKNKECMCYTLITSLVRITSFIILSLFKIGLYGLVIATIIGIILSTLLHIKCIKKCFN